MRTLVLNNKGYEPFIDFMKGICIMWVVLTHSIPYELKQLIGFPLWGAQAVPMFLLIQSYHYFKHKELPSIHWMKLFRRIILPFVAVEAVIALSIFIASLCGSGGLMASLRALIASGGVGPGSYYVWIYLQFALILLPLFGRLQKKVHLSSIVWAIIFILISEGLEILCSFWHPDGKIYRLLSFRYIFLIYGGYLWAKHGVKCNWYTIALSLFSIVMIILLQYRNFTLEPLIYDTTWRYFHWFCYFWVIFALTTIVNALYNIQRERKITEIIKAAGRYSYQIFMVQLMVFYWFPSEINSWVYMIATTILSIVPVLVYNTIKGSY